jgi:hypothetical protein
MMHFACLCGHREEADRTPLCPTCKEDMRTYEPPIVPPNWRTIGQVSSGVVRDIERKMRGRK